MEHIHDILSALAYSLKNWRCQEGRTHPDYPEAILQSVYLPPLHPKISLNNPLDNIMNVVSRHLFTCAERHDGWVYLCAQQYARHPALEREEFAKIHLEYFEVRSSELLGVFDYLVLTKKGQAIGRQICEDADSLFQNLVPKMLQYDKFCLPQHRCGFVYVTRE